MLDLLCNPLNHYRFWYILRIFCKVSTFEGNISAAVTTLAAGAEYAGRINAQNTRILFSLSQAMALLIQRLLRLALLKLHYLELHYLGYITWSYIT